MYLATVTCLRDFDQMLLQAESIGKFVEPCTHVVVINDENPDLNFWYKWLMPYYKNHELLLYPAVKVKSTHPKTLKETSGWNSQQLHKFLIGLNCYHINDDDYLILDSKNFFIKPTKLSEYENIIGSGLLDFVNKTPFKICNEYYAELFNVEPLEKILVTSTPFVIKTTLIRQYTRESLEKIFLEGENSKGEPVHPSEFIFYSYLVKEYLQDMQEIVIGLQFYKNEIDNLAYHIHGLHTKHVKICGIHRELLHMAYPSAIDFLNDWLYNLGLENKLYPIPLNLDYNQTK